MLRSTLADHAGCRFRPRAPGTEEFVDVDEFGDALEAPALQVFELELLLQASVYV